jgi:hypothetical protein
VDAAPDEIPGRGVPRAGADVQAVLRHDVDFWTVGYERDSFQLKDTKGLIFLQTLLRYPGREFHVLDLAGGGEHPQEGSGRAASGDAGELLDPAARAAYKRKLEDLRDALEEARRWSDLERAARAEHEIAFLTDELAHAVGLGGRSRTAASAAERARVNVSRTIGAVVKKIAAGSPALGTAPHGRRADGLLLLVLARPAGPSRLELLNTPAPRTAPNATEFPGFECTSVAPDGREMIYRSARPLADLAEGLIRGRA